MIELPKCPRCGLRIEASRMRTPLVDSNLNPIYSIYCGCPDCETIVFMQTSVSIGLFCMNEVTQEFWDLNYENALELWKEKYGKKEESE